jgi:hypothetical protein
MRNMLARLQAVIRTLLSLVTLLTIRDSSHHVSMVASRSKPDGGIAQEWIARVRGLDNARCLISRDRRRAHTAGPKGIVALAALGVVFGDIGTDPLYAFRQCFHNGVEIAPTPENVTGVVSLIPWSLIFVVSIKYLTFVMRADHDGEGGILALLALVFPAPARCLMHC